VGGIRKPNKQTEMVERIRDETRKKKDIGVLDRLPQALFELSTNILLFTYDECTGIQIPEQSELSTAR
jgi:hypothetical protein